jgi:hypothetical protein
MNMRGIHLKGMRGKSNAIKNQGRSMLGACYLSKKIGICILIVDMRCVCVSTLDVARKNIHGYVLHIFLVITLLHTEHFHAETHGMICRMSTTNGSDMRFDARKKPPVSQ